MGKRCHSNGEVSAHWLVFSSRCLPSFCILLLNGRAQGNLHDHGSCLELTKLARREVGALPEVHGKLPFND
jgi:hypothetical protein